ncbi:Uncharacterised protein [Neisseria zoodegmatis]|uniref:Uncharacterized protein n=1 Tax=Neisseria zoodegmatis TaxID=326523 RepID=A0AB38DNM6_9NEIS|nr:hypothetical protein BWD10_11985 [Neisseria zoodegmatis]SNU78817.1 Uncharacterised protein [Neisseria zoodegmatis]
MSWLMVGAMWDSFGKYVAFLIINSYLIVKMNDKIYFKWSVAVFLIFNGIIIYRLLNEIIPKYQYWLG